MFSLGFDTLIINYSAHSELSEIFDIFYPLGIKNFIFTHNIDLVNDSLSFAIDSSKAFKKSASSISPRGTKIKTASCVSYADELSQNPYLKKLSVCKKSAATFISLPIFPSFSDNTFSSELNKLIYRSKIFPVFNSFDRIIKTSSPEFYTKLLSVNRSAFVLDINFLTDPRNLPIINNILTNHTDILPCISCDISNYVSVSKNFEDILKTLGKTNYYRLCSLINKSSMLLGV